MNKRTAVSKYGMHRFPVTPEFEKKHHASVDSFNYLTGELLTK